MAVFRLMLLLTAAVVLHSWAQAQPLPSDQPPAPAGPTPAALGPSAPGPAAPGTTTTSTIDLVWITPTPESTTQAALTTMPSPGPAKTSVSTANPTTTPPLAPTTTPTTTDTTPTTTSTTTTITTAIHDNPTTTVASANPSTLANPTLPANLATQEPLSSLSSEVPRSSADSSPSQTTRVTRVTPDPGSGSTKSSQEEVSSDGATGKPLAAVGSGAPAEGTAVYPGRRSIQIPEELTRVLRSQVNGIDGGSSAEGTQDDDNGANSAGGFLPLVLLFCSVHLLM